MRLGAALLQLLLIQLREGVAAQSVNQSGSVDNSTDTSITTTTVGIVVTRGHYPHEITWMLSCNQSSEDYIGYAPFRGTVELVMGDDCVLSMADSYCDGWDTAALRIFDQLFTLESGCYDTFSFTADFLPPSPPAPPPPPSAPPSPPFAPSPPAGPPPSPFAPQLGVGGDDNSRLKDNLLESMIKYTGLLGLGFMCALGMVVTFVMKHQIHRFPEEPEPPVESDLTPQESHIELATVEALHALPVHSYAGGAKKKAPTEVATAEVGITSSEGSASTLAERVEAGDLQAVEEECILCMEDFKSGDEVRSLPCGHYFHTACIDKWLVVAQRNKARTCPLCKADPVKEARVAAFAEHAAAMRAEAIARREDEEGERRAELERQARAAMSTTGTGYGNRANAFSTHAWASHDSNFGQGDDNYELGNLNHVWRSDYRERFHV